MNTKMNMNKLMADFPPVAQMADYKEIFWINPDSGKGGRPGNKSALFLPPK